MANLVSDKQMKRMCEDSERLGFRPERLLLLDNRLEEWSNSGMTPSIAARVLRHGELAFEGAYGMLGPDTGEALMTVDAIFPVCAITKTVISTLLSIMQEEGLVDLNDPVRLYIPEFTGDADSEIRIWHLLTHTSGIIDDDLDQKFYKYISETLKLKMPDGNIGEEEWNDTMAKIREKMGLPAVEPSQKMRSDTYMAARNLFPPAYKPQKVMSYSNSGYNLATEIINRLSGMSIDEYAAEKLFLPLKMNDSHFLFPTEKLTRYVTREDGFVGSKWLNDGILDSESGPGGLKSTVIDMTRFGQMYLNNGTLDGVTVLSPYSIREIISDHCYCLPVSEHGRIRNENNWGMGWSIKGSKKDDSGMLRSASSIEHGGFGGCKLMVDPEADIVAAYFTVCKTDTYYKAAAFNNMVLGALIN